MIDASHSAVMSSPTREYEEAPYIDRSRPMVQVSVSGREMKKDRFWPVFLATLVAGLGSLSFGFTIGFTSPVEHGMEADQDLPLTKSEFSWFAALLAVGSIFGALIGGVCIDRFGRKTSLMLYSLPFALGWLLITYANHKIMLYVGRFLTGIAVGSTSLTVPVYIAEIASPRLRGGLGSVNQLAIVTGICVVYAVGYFLSWRWTAVVGIFPVVLMVLLMSQMPETPRWLLAANLRHNALKALSWLRGPEYDIEEECFEIESNLDLQEKLSIVELLKPKLRRPLVISCFLMIFQQFSGINAILFYASDIFKVAGFQDFSLISLAVGFAQVLATGLACLIVDKSGRRVLLLIGSVGMTVCNTLLGIYYEIAIIPQKKSTDVNLSHTKGLLGSSIAHTVDQADISWLAVTSTVMYVILFSLGWGPLPWLLMSEIFPPRARGTAGGIATLVNWLFVFIVAKTFTNLVKVFTQQGAFWFFAVWCALSIVFVYFFVPETKGKSLEEIEADMNHTSTSTNR